MCPLGGFTGAHKYLVSSWRGVPLGSPRPSTKGTSPYEHFRASSKYYVYIYIYICYMMYVCMHVCMYVCVYIYIYIHMGVCVYIYIYVYMCIYTSSERFPDRRSRSLRGSEERARTFILHYIIVFQNNFTDKTKHSYIRQNTLPIKSVAILNHVILYYIIS